MEKARAAMTPIERYEAVQSTLLSLGYSETEARKAEIKRLRGHWEVWLGGEYIGTYDFMRGAFAD